MDTSGQVVLVADSDETVLKTVSSTLEKSGVTVLVANSKSAVKDLSGRAAHLELAIVDSAMAKADYGSLLDVLNQWQPGVPVMLTSSTDDAASESLGRAGQVRGFMRKPFRRS